MGELPMKLTALATAFVAFLTSLAAPADADVTHVAVAANFTEPAKEIAALFKQKTGHEAVLIFGASGAFYTQITHSAPFEVFLSADEDRPKAAVDQGFAVPDSRFTYAIGKLVLWSRVIDATNAELGFVALAQLHGQTAGTQWEVPSNLHAPIRQDAVLLKTGANSEASKAFLDFLKGPEARGIIEQFGYSLP